MLLPAALFAKHPGLFHLWATALTWLRPDPERLTAGNGERKSGLSRRKTDKPGDTKK